MTFDTSSPLASGCAPSTTSALPPLDSSSGANSFFEGVRSCEDSKGIRAGSTGDAELIFPDSVVFRFQLFLYDMHSGGLALYVRSTLFELIDCKLMVFIFDFLLNQVHISIKPVPAASKGFDVQAAVLVCSKGFS